MTVKLLTEHHLEFLSLKGGCTESSEFTLVKMSHCWKSHVAAQNDYLGLVHEGLVHITYAWVKVKNFQNPELSKLHS